MSETRLQKAGVHRTAHLESVIVIYNVQRFSTPCTGLLSLLAALSPEPAVLTGEMDVSLCCRLNKSPSSLSIFISVQNVHLVRKRSCLTAVSWNVANNERNVSFPLLKESRDSSENLVKCTYDKTSLQMLLQFDGLSNQPHCARGFMSSCLSVIHALTLEYNGI